MLGMSVTMRLIVPLLIATLACPMLGCSYGSYDKPIRFYPDRHAGRKVSGRVPHSGEYEIVARPYVGPALPWSGVRTTAEKGDHLGFAQRGGELFAIVGDLSVHLGVPPKSTEYIAWATSEHRLGMTDQPSRLVGEALAVTGSVIVLGALIGTVLVLKLTQDDDDCEHDYRCDCD